MKNIDSIKEHLISEETIEGGWTNFVVDLGENKFGIVFTKKMDNGWEFVSTKILDETALISAFLRQKTYHSSQEETCLIRNMFFEAEDPVIEFFPKESSFLSETTLCLFSNKEIKVPTNEAIKAPGRKITLPNRKLVNLRASIEGNWERFNIRLLNKKQNIVKRYLQHEDMISFKDQNLSNDDCVSFIFSDLNSDYSVDLYKPVNYNLDIPLFVFDELDSLIYDINYDEIVKQVAKLDEEFAQMIPEVYEEISNLMDSINVDIQVKTVKRYKSIN